MTLSQQAQCALEQLLAVANCQAGDIVVIGCSSSEVIGEKIGTSSSLEVATQLVEAILPTLQARGLFLAAQCCEHLNRALIVESACAKQYGLEQVNVMPQPKAGGSFATAVFSAMEHPVAVEHIQAMAGLDIGGTLIGMHLRHVAVPVRLEQKKIGEAMLLAARVRPKFIGGARAIYQDTLL